ncbi:MAG: hypothetical protein CM1200mP3_13510 [Chloroflexota bacterium]|nr:MAG: hypothetical protein CM1200mP3_13510 [Chloroflexota bacterium]
MFANAEQEFPESSQSEGDEKNFLRSNLRKEKTMERLENIASGTMRLKKKNPTKKKEKQMLHSPENIIPYVVERDPRGERTYDIYSLLLRNALYFLALE